MIRFWTAALHPEITAYPEFFPVFRSPFHMCFDGLVIGMFAAIIYRDRHNLSFTQDPRIAESLAWGGIALSFYLLTADSHMSKIDLFDKTLLQTLIALGMGCTLLGTLLGGGPIQLLKKDWLCFFSKISYSLYLIHLPLVPLTNFLLTQIFPVSDFSPLQQFLIFLSFYNALSIFAALFLHYTVEKPFLLVKDRKIVTQAG